MNERFGETLIPETVIIPVQVKGKMLEYFGSYFTEEYLADYLFVKLCELYNTVKDLEDCYL